MYRYFFEKKCQSLKSRVLTSVVDQNSMYLDPNPEFLQNLDPDPGLCYKF